MILVEVIALNRAARELGLRFGLRIEAGYVPGKTAFRDALCDRFGLSQLDSEAICESLEAAKLIRFESAPMTGACWTIARVD
jgi:hypothetical protein